MPPKEFVGCLLELTEVVHIYVTHFFVVKGLSHSGAVRASLL